MEVRLGVEEFMASPLVAEMIRCLLRNQHEINQRESGHLEFNYHGREVVFDVRVARDRIQVPLAGVVKKKAVG